ncbi:hypothetical protein HPB52_016009 [Rhipicephalus sanguineus]|uniref:Uncharacterized protein n=1 Tax=Rhipicephalus sanguineus TaxID=34632 RepID=A0A9D4Q118_RHISA|nr:hypothetical protein HPB52_016009 [Rhipicephalus sanguineus]
MRLEVRWRPVLSGLLLQFVLGLFLVRWHVGRVALACFAEKIAAVISFASHGGGFVFGYLSTGDLEGGLPRQEPVLGVTVVSIMVFFGLLVSLLCHYGILQCLALWFARLIAATIGTTALESYCAACSIYLGMADSAALVRPYLVQLTRSELHTVMTCGFATISGSLFAVFAIFGVRAEDMLAASVMSAPAALGFSKLFYPETEDSRSNLESIKDVRRSCTSSSNVFESMARSVSSLLAVAANVVASLLGCVAFVALADALLAYIGALLGWQLSVNWLVGRLFVPLALSMGLSVDESSRVASLVGLKTVLNEVFAQSEMGGMARDGLLSPRAQLLCTHALCGFSSLGALGVQLGVFAALAPERLPDCARVAGRALIAGSVTCFLTACTAAQCVPTCANITGPAKNKLDASENFVDKLKPKQQQRRRRRNQKSRKRPPCDGEAGFDNQRPKKSEETSSEPKREAPQYKMTENCVVEAAAPCDPSKDESEAMEGIASMSAKRGHSETIEDSDLPKDASGGPPPPKSASMRRMSLKPKPSIPPDGRPEAKPPS